MIGKNAQITMVMIMENLRETFAKVWKKAGDERLLLVFSGFVLSSALFGDHARGYVPMITGAVIGVIGIFLGWRDLRNCSYQDGYYRGRESAGPLIDQHRKDAEYWQVRSERTAAENQRLTASLKEAEDWIAAGAADARERNIA